MTNFKNALTLANAALLAITLSACGASEPAKTTLGSATSSTSSAEAASTPKQRHWKQSRVVTQQEAICNRVCLRLSECSVAYAESHLSPAVANQMSMPAGRAQQLQECRSTRSECQMKQATQKGVNQSGQCLRENQECSALISCLD